MEELKPVPPAPKKKTSLLVRLLAFLLTLALLLGAVDQTSRSLPTLEKPPRPELSYRKDSACPESLFSRER